MKSARYAAEYKTKAVKQVTERGHAVVEMAQRLGVSDKSLYAWIKKARQQSPPLTGDVAALQGQLTRLKADLKRTTEERDMLKKAAAYFARVAE
jgi:transposase